MKFVKMQYAVHEIHVKIFKMETKLLDENGYNVLDARFLDENGHNVLDLSYNNTSRYLNLVEVCSLPVYRSISITILE